MMLEKIVPRSCHITENMQARKVSSSALKGKDFRP